MNKKLLISGIISTIVVAILLYLVLKRKVKAASIPTPSITASNVATPSPPSATPTPTATPSQSPSPAFPISLTIPVSGPQNVLIPVYSDKFVISVVPPQNSSVDVQVWFNTINDTKLHDDSLVITTNGNVTITQTTPILVSDTLKAQGIPYEGYSYIVISVSGPCVIRASFTI